jgi:hypothetical protein
VAALSRSRSRITTGRPVGAGADVLVRCRRRREDAAPGGGRADGLAEQDADRYGRGSKRPHDPGGGSPEAAPASGLIGQLLLLHAGQVLADIEPVEGAEHRAQVRVGPAYCTVDQAKLALLAVTEFHRMLLAYDPAVGGLGAVPAT